MAPKKKEYDPNLIRNLAAIHCTMNEIATALGCSVDLLERRFADIIKEGRDQGKTSLRRHMWKAATEKGNITMMIWLSKQLLGMTDRIEAKQEINQITEIKSDKESREQLKQLMTNPEVMKSLELLSNALDESDKKK